MTRISLSSLWKNHRISLAFALIVFALVGIALANPSQEKDNYQHTKAVCEGRECQDFLITCSGSQVVEMTPLTGLITFSEDWKDPRNEEERKLC